MHRRLPVLIALLLLGGCNATIVPFTPEEKARSMSDLAHRKLSVAGSYLSPTGNSMVFSSDVPGYLRSLTAQVISSDTLSEEKVKVSVSSEIISQEGSSIHRTAHIDVSLADIGEARLGQAVLASNDGYFLTAGHVVDNENSVLLFKRADLKSGAPEMDVVRFRIVHLDRPGDLAILKANIRHPFHFSLNDSELDSHEPVFAGAWGLGGIGHGELLRPWRRSVFRKSSIGTTHWAMSTPIVAGDSGSAVIDADGNLVGITVAAGTGFSIFAKADFSRVRDLIDADRASQLPLSVTAQ